MHLVVAIAVTHTIIRDWRAALAVGLIEPAAQTLAFLIHDRVWARIEARARARMPNTGALVWRRFTSADLFEPSRSKRSAPSAAGFHRRSRRQIASVEIREIIGSHPSRWRCGAQAWRRRQFLNPVSILERSRLRPYEAPGSRCTHAGVAHRADKHAASLDSAVHDVRPAPSGDRALEGAHPQPARTSSGASMFTVEQ